MRKMHKKKEERSMKKELQSNDNGQKILKGVGKKRIQNGKKKAFIKSFQTKSPERNERISLIEKKHGSGKVHRRYDRGFLNIRYYVCRRGGGNFYIMQGY